MKSSKAIVEAYLKQSDWRTKENSNSPFSFGAMNKYITAEVSKDYWLREVYPEHVAQAYVDGHMHIHDLGGLTLYCSGYSLREILMKGVRGISNIPVSAPAKHFDSVLNQCANLVTVFQNEIMGAVAFNSFDTLLAPFIKVDKLGYNEVRQAMQNFIFSVNSNSRGGAEPAFFNLTFDLTPPADMIEDYAIVGGELVSFTYGSCQQEMDLLNRVFFEIMLEGDASGKLFSYPIPTYMIHRRFDWDNPNNKLLWEMAGKYGVPYFANYINSDMDIGDVRSMCCRLSLDLRELRRRNGGLFGSGDSTGSIGVVTLNLPRLAYEAHGDRQKFWDSLDRYMDIAKESLEIKRKWLNENVIDTHLLPAFMEYVGSLRNYFSTIGMIGGNEMCLNLIGKDIRSDEGHALMRDVLNHMRERLVMYQEETGNLYNLEGTPAEGCSYSLALKDKKEYPDIITQGSGQQLPHLGRRHSGHQLHLRPSERPAAPVHRRHRHPLLHGRRDPRGARQADRPHDAQPVQRAVYEHLPHLPLLPGARVRHGARGQVPDLQTAPAQVPAHHRVSAGHRQLQPRQGQRVQRPRPADGVIV